MEGKGSCWKEFKVHGADVFSSGRLRAGISAALSEALESVESLAACTSGYWILARVAGDPYPVFGVSVVKIRRLRGAEHAWFDVAVVCGDSWRLAANLLCTLWRTTAGSTFYICSRVSSPVGPVVRCLTRSMEGVARASDVGCACALPGYMFASYRVVSAASFLFDGEKMPLLRCMQ